MNINDSVTVVLTKYGADVYNDFRAKYSPYIDKVEGDTLRDSLWHIMQIFGGDNIGLGKTLPFVEYQFGIARKEGFDEQ